MIFLSKLDEGEKSNTEIGGESDDDEVESNSVRTDVLTIFFLLYRCDLQWTSNLGFPFL